jgi:hypothetical protein
VVETTRVASLGRSKDAEFPADVSNYEILLYESSEGRMMGLEPTNGGTTNLCLNPLATPAMPYL